MDINNTLFSILENKLTIDKKMYASELTLKELGMTSLSFVKIVVAIEEEFDIEFDDNDFEMDKFTFVDDLISYIFKAMEG